MFLFSDITTSDYNQKLKRNNHFLPYGIIYDKFKIYVRIHDKIHFEGMLFMFYLRIMYSDIDLHFKSFFNVMKVRTYQSSYLEVIPFELLYNRKKDLT